MGVGFELPELVVLDTIDEFVVVVSSEGMSLYSVEIHVPQA